MYLRFGGILIVSCLFFLLETILDKHCTTNLVELDGKLTSCEYEESVASQQWGMNSRTITAVC